MKDGRDYSTPKELAYYLCLEENEVSKVLEGFKGIFRRSRNLFSTKDYGDEYRYMLHLRYARRRYENNKVSERAAPLSNEDLFGLLNYISGKIVQEFENDRLEKTTRNSLVGIWIAGVFSIFATALGLIALLFK